LAFKSQEASVVLEWAHDILKFVRDVFGVSPTSQQTELLLSVQKMVWAKLRVNKLGGASEEDKKLSSKFGISTMAGVGTGKGAVACWVIIWFLGCFPFPKCRAVAPSAHQLKDNLWAELSKWHNKCKLKDWFVWQTDKFFFKEHEGKEWFITARTANTKNSPEEQAETLAGLHEDFVLIICDEASGIPDPVYRPLESTLTRTCNFCLLFFNPTRSKGYAYDTHYRDRDSWVQHRWNAEESELVSRESIARLEKKYGRDSNTFRIRVLGLPPVAGDNTIIPWEWIVDAVERDIEAMDNDELILSLDVGAGGDDSVMLRRRGPIISPLEAVNYAESEKVTDWATRLIVGYDPKMTLVDSIGIGWGIAGNLRKALPDRMIRDVNVAQQALNTDRFFRLRDELWWRLREQFEHGLLSIPDDALLMGDLNAPRYDESSGKVKVESKKDMKNRGIDSPNRADALMMTTIYGSDVVRQMNRAPLHRKRKRVGGWRTA
jgi:phage terminase large subunit